MKGITSDRKETHSQLVIVVFKKLLVTDPMLTGFVGLKSTGFHNQ